MNYTLHQLQVFLKVTQSQSITKAAEELFLTQPAVSIQLKNFQDQFDIPLTEVVGRKLYVTDFGKEIALAAEKIIHEVYEINFKTMAYKGKLSGRLKISAVSTGKYVMPFFLSGFMKLHPEVELILDVTNKSRVIESLERNELDIALVSLLPDHLQIEQVPLLTNELYLVGNREREFEDKIYEQTLLQELPLIYREKGSATRLVMEKFIEQHNIPFRHKMELTTNEAVKQAVIAGLGYSIMPLIGIRNELLNGELQIIQVKDLPIRSTWTLIWMKGKKFSPVATAYMDYIKKEKDNIVAERFSGYRQND